MDEQSSRAINVRRLQESRDGVRSLQFFVAAMAAQLRDMHDKMAEVEVDLGGGEFQERVSQLEQERDTARLELAAAQARVTQLDAHIQALQQDIERQRVTFADHHAAKQEIAKLRAELAMLAPAPIPEMQNDDGEEPDALDQSGQRRQGWFKSR